MEYSSPNSSGISSDSDGADSWKGGVPGCAKCGNIIYDKTLLCILGKVWHPSCLQCSVCGKQLGTSCYSNGSNILCYDDYIRTNTFKCASCGIVLADNEYVRKVHGNVYHQDCFRCVCCGNHLETGEKFYLRDDDKLVCADDYNTRKTKDFNENDSDSECSTGSGKRHRTSITPQQLHCLVTAYEQNPKPSREARRRLSRDLRLDYRVIQVWFQNRRAKNKKNGTTNGQENNERSFYSDSPLNEQYRVPPTFHDRLYSTPTKRHGEWLTTMLAHDSVPPNIDLSPVDLLNGEILRKNRIQPEREQDTERNEPRRDCVWQQNII